MIALILDDEEDVLQCTKLKVKFVYIRRAIVEHVTVTVTVTLQAYLSFKNILKTPGEFRNSHGTVTLLLCVMKP